MSARGRGGGKTPDKVIQLLSDAVSQSSQAAVAKETGLTRQTVQRYLQGIGEPSGATLQKLADYFGVSVAELRGEKPTLHKVMFIGDEMRTEMMGVAGLISTPLDEIQQLGIDIALSIFQKFDDEQILEQIRGWRKRLAPKESEATGGKIKISNLADRLSIDPEEVKERMKKMGIPIKDDPQ